MLYKNIFKVGSVLILFFFSLELRAPKSLSAQASDKFYEAQAHSENGRHTEAAEASTARANLLQQDAELAKGPEQRGLIKDVADSHWSAAKSH